MKRLLILLCTLTTSTTLATNVVSCANKYDHKDEDGSNYFYYLPRTDKENQYFSTTDAWNKLGLGTINLSSDPTILNNIDPKIQANITQNIMKMFNVSAMNNIGQGNLPLASNLKNVAQFSDLKTIMNDQWSILDESVNQQVQAKKDSEGKGYKKWLKDNYDGDEKKYRSFLYEQGDGTPSASTLMSQSLANNYQADYNYNLDVTATSLYQKLNSYIGNPTTPITDDEWKNLCYATIGQTDDATFKSEFDSDLATLKPLTTGKDAKYHYDYDGLVKASNNESGFKNTYISISKDLDGSNPNFLTPNLDANGNYEFNYNDPTSSLNGMLSPSQEFIEANWFKAEHPLAVSQILVKYNNVPKGETKFDFTKDKFTDRFASWNGLFTNDTLKNISQILKVGTSADPKGAWNNMMDDVANNKSKFTDISSKYESSLLTANAKASSDDGFANEYFKANIYNSIIGYEDSKSPSDTVKITNNDDSNIKDLATTFDGGTGKIDSGLLLNNTAGYDKTKNALTNNDMFQVYNINKAGGDVSSNVVVYFDSLGMHIVHIDGVDQLAKASSNDDKFLTGYTRDKQNLGIRKYNQYMSHNQANHDYGSNDYNNPTNSTYLDWLNANAYSINSKNPLIKTPYTYNLNDELKNFTTFDATKDTLDSTNQTMWFWDYELIKWYANEDGKNNDWLSTLLDFGNTITSKNISFIFKTELANYNQHLNALYQTNINSILHTLVENKDKNHSGPQGGISQDEYANAFENKDYNDYWDTWN